MIKNTNIEFQSLYPYFHFSNPSLGDKGRWESTYWPLHTPLKRETLTLSSSSAEVIEGHKVQECAFWKRFLPQLGNGTFDGCGQDDDFFYHNYPYTNLISNPGERIIIIGPHNLGHCIALQCSVSQIVSSHHIWIDYES